MVVSFGGNNFGCRLKDEYFSDMNEDKRIWVFFPQRVLYKLHKFINGDDQKPPLDRNTWMEFSWELDDITLHVSGSNNESYYKESISSVVLPKCEKIMILKEIKKYFIKSIDKLGFLCYTLKRTQNKLKDLNTEMWCNGSM